MDYMIYVFICPICIPYIYMYMYPSAWLRSRPFGIEFGPWTTWVPMFLPNATWMFMMFRSQLAGVKNFRNIP